MLIGVPREIKTHEYRVGLVPASVHELIHHGHKVLVESGAGLGIGFDDKAYRAAGARIVASAAEVFASQSFRDHRGADQLEATRQRTRSPNQWRTADCGSHDRQT